MRKQKYDPTVEQVEQLEVAMNRIEEAIERLTEADSPHVKDAQALVQKIYGSMNLTPAPRRKRQAKR